MDKWKHTYIASEVYIPLQQLSDIIKVHDKVQKTSESKTDDSDLLGCTYDYDAALRQKAISSVWE